MLTCDNDNCLPCILAKWPCNVATKQFVYFCLELWNGSWWTSAYRSRLCVTRPSGCRDPASSVSFSSASLLSNLLPTGGRDSVEVAGCRFPVDFDDWLVVIHDHQKKVGHLRRLPPGYYLSLCSLFRYFQNGKINIFAQYLCLIYAQENARESLQL